MDKKCSIVWCNREHYAKGYCHAHWIAERRYGSPYGKRKEEMERIDELIKSAQKICHDILNIPWVDCPFCNKFYGQPHADDCTRILSAKFLKQTEQR